MTALAKVAGGGQLARKEDGLSDEQINLIKNTIAKGASNDELALFISTANRLRLDPFARQIFLVKRWDSQVNGYVATPQVSVDGFRLVAERTGEYRGQTAPQWCGKDGKWTDVWLHDAPPAAARVGVYRDGFAEPLVRVALYKSYAQTKKDGSPNAMWAKYPEVMLAKCAESLALRSAFPNELSGIYTSDELPEEQEQKPRERPPAKTAEQRMDEIARGGERAETRPTETSSPPSSEPSTPPSTASSATAETGELLDAKAWRARYEAEASAALDAGYPFVGEDESGLPVPGGEMPTIPAKARQHAGKAYDQIPPGYLREVIVPHESFAGRAQNVRLHALYLVAAHELAKEQAP